MALFRLWLHLYILHKHSEYVHSRSHEVIQKSRFVHTVSRSTCTDCMWCSAGSIPKISKYRDTCESSIPIFSGIAILRYFWYRTPTIRYLRYLRYPSLDIESIRRSRCEGATSLLVTTLFTGAITTALRSLN